VYPLRIVKAERKNSKAGNAMISLAIKIEGTAGAEAPLVNENLMIPTEGSEYYRFQMRNVSRFLGLFGVSSFDPDSAEDVGALEGLTAECYLTIEEYEGKESNKLRLPKVGKR
jgi:hypothetical protein